MIHAIQHDLRQLIHLHKEKPYLPLWGEFFYVLQKLKDMDGTASSNIFLYETENSAPIFYQLMDDRFRIMLPGFNLLLTKEQFIDNILEGKFWPAY